MNFERTTYFKRRSTKNPRPVQQLVVNIHGCSLNGTVHDKRSQPSAEFHSSILEHNWKSLGGKLDAAKMSGSRDSRRLSNRRKGKTRTPCPICLCPLAQAIRQSLPVRCVQHICRIAMLYENIWYPNDLSLNYARMLAFDDVISRFSEFSSCGLMVQQIQLLVSSFWRQILQYCSESPVLSVLEDISRIINN